MRRTKVGGVLPVSVNSGLDGKGPYQGAIADLKAFTAAASNSPSVCLLI
jgi:hypothetical protein